jgi:hypothetical protein
MPIFRPPTDNFMALGVKPKEFDTQKARLAYRLFKNFAPEPQGRNVFLLTNGTYTENEPNDITTIAKTYLGGHDNEISAEEATSLTAAGYGPYIT